MFPANKSGNNLQTIEGMEGTTGLICKISIGIRLNTHVFGVLNYKLCITKIMKYVIRVSLVNLTSQ